MTCDRYEREVLPAIERGESLPEHVEQCDVCRDKHTQYTKLKQLIAQGPGEKPAPGWQERVLSADTSSLAAGPSRRSKYATWGALAASIAALVVIQLNTERAFDPRLEIDNQSGSVITRGAGSTLGDRLILTANGLGSATATLILYAEDGAPVANCDRELSCVRNGDQLKATYQTTFAGSLRAVLYATNAGERHLPDPRARFNQALTNAAERQIDALVSERIVIR